MRYGMNPHQSATVVSAGGPKVVNGEPSMINLLDGLNAFELVREADAVSGSAAAASFSMSRRQERRSPAASTRPQLEYGASRVMTVHLRYPRMCGRATLIPSPRLATWSLCRGLLTCRPLNS